MSVRKLVRTSEPFAQVSLVVCRSFFNSINTGHTGYLVLCVVQDIGSSSNKLEEYLYRTDNHQLTPHAYADDTQIYGSCRPADSAVLSEKLSVCMRRHGLGMDGSQPASA